MIILALDLATSTGFAVLDTVAGDPLFGTHRMPPCGRDFGGRFAAFDTWLARLIDEHRPDRAVYEKPITTLHGKTSLEAKVGLIGLCAMTEFRCACEKIPVGWINNNECKKHFVGRGNFGKSQKPYPTLVACHDRGWFVETTDEADACALADYAAHVYDPANASRLDPIMRGAAA